MAGLQDQHCWQESSVDMLAGFDNDPVQRKERRNELYPTKVKSPARHMIMEICCIFALSEVYPGETEAAE